VFVKFFSLPVAQLLPLAKLGGSDDVDILLRNNHLIIGKPVTLLRLHGVPALPL
jgi:hypothetical protein